MYLTFKNLGKYGALGNQLWQIAGTIGRAITMGAEPRFPKWDYAKWFNVPDQFFLPVPRGALVDDLGKQYLQDINIWWCLRDEIFSYIAPSEFANEELDSIYEGIDLSSFIGVYVRRDSNLTLSEHQPVPTLDYFEFGIDIVKSLGRKDNVIVFSNDINWCRKQSIFKDALFGEGVPKNIDMISPTPSTPLLIAAAARDLLALSRCGDFVISNSSFSIWSALISGYRQSFKWNVVAPINWYGSAISEMDHTLMTRGLGVTYAGVV